MINIPNELKRRIQGGDLITLETVLNDLLYTNTNTLIHSRDGPDLDNQLKGKCQLLKELIELVKRQ